MHKKTREALELLIKHGPGYLTTEATFVDGKGKSATPFINLTTANSLERRGLVTIDDDGENSTIQAISQS